MRAFTAARGIAAERQKQLLRLPTAFCVALLSCEFAFPCAHHSFVDKFSSGAGMDTCGPTSGSGDRVKFLIPYSSSTLRRLTPDDDLYHEAFRRLSIADVSVVDELCQHGNTDIDVTGDTTGDGAYNWRHVPG